MLSLKFLLEKSKDADKLQKKKKNKKKTDKFDAIKNLYFMQIILISIARKLRLLYWLVGKSLLLEVTWATETLEYHTSAKRYWIEKPLTH